MLKLKKLSRLFLTSIILTGLLVAAVIGFFWFKELTSNLDHNALELRNSRIEQRKQLIKTEVKEAESFITLEKARIDKNIYSYLASELDILLASANQLSNYTSGRKLSESIFKIAPAFNSDIFIIDQKGIMLVNTFEPKLVNKHVSQIVALDSKTPYQELFNSSQTKISNLKFKLNDPSDNIIAEATYSKNAKMVLGVQISQSIFMDESRRNIIQTLGSIKLQNNSYFLVTDLKGYLHANFGSVHDLPVYVEHVQDGEGNHIYQEMRNTALRDKYFFYRYFYPKHKGGKPIEKISYIVLDEDLGIMYGTGVYYEDLEEGYLKKIAEIKSYTYKNIALSLLIIVVLCLIITVFAIKISRKIDKEFKKLMFLIDHKAKDLSTISNSFYEIKETGEKVKILTLNQQETEQEIKRNHLLNSKNFLNTSDLTDMMNTLQEGLMLRDNDGKILKINKALKNMLELNTDDIYGRTVGSLGLKLITGANNLRLCIPIPSFNLSLFNDEKIKLFAVQTSEVVTDSQNTKQLLTSFIDITPERELREEILRQKASLEYIKKTTGTGTIEFDLETEVITLSELVYNMHGIKPDEEPTLELFLNHINEKYRNRVKRYISDLIENDIPFETKYKTNDIYDQERWMHLKLYSKISLDAKKTILGIVQDVTTISKIEDILKKTEEKLKQSSQIIYENLITVKMNTEGEIVGVSKAFCEVSKYETNELLGKKLISLRYYKNRPPYIQEIVKAVSPWIGEVKYTDKNGNIFWLSEIITKETNTQGELTALVLIAHNITDKKKVEEISITDMLTGLYNRKTFNRIFPAEINRLKRETTFITFTIANIDNFKNYNVLYGFIKTDEMLSKVAECLKSFMLRSSDFSFRIDSGEFALIFSGLDTEQSGSLLEKIRSAIEELDIEYKDNPVSPHITMSFGSVCAELSQSSTLDAETLYKIARQELINAKDSGKNFVSIKAEY